MDNDPPPSYKSVVESKNGTTDEAGNTDDRQRSGHSICQRNQDSRELAETGQIINNDIQATDNDVRDNYCNENGNNIPTSGQPEQQYDQQRPTGLWQRFKKGLEDLALIVIQVLD